MSTATSRCRSKPARTIRHAPLSSITHIKLGQEWLKPKNGGLEVWSEVWRLKGLNKPDKVYAVAFQNLLFNGLNGPADVAFMIRRAIQKYET